MTSILIVDDMPIIRSALTRIISEQGGIFSPILEAANGEEAVALARAHKPDIILMDIKMPGLTGLQATSIIQQEQPDVKIVILTAYQDSSQQQDSIQVAIQYIQENYQRSDISLQEVADEVNLSQSHLSSQFKMRTRTSYMNYLTTWRIDEAKKLLRTTDQSIATVAEMVGYPNTTNFYRHFRKQTKMTPATYRQKKKR